MRTHVKVIAVLFVLFGGLFLASALFSGLVLGVLTGVVGSSGDEGAELGAAILGLSGMALVVALTAFALPSFACGWGLLKTRRWARVLAIVLAAISLLRIPFGTIFGIYVLVIMFQKETERIFERPVT